MIVVLTVLDLSLLKSFFEFITSNPQTSGAVISGFHRVNMDPIPSTVLLVEKLAGNSASSHKNERHANATNLCIPVKNLELVRTEVRGTMELCWGASKWEGSRSATSRAPKTSN